MLPQYCLLAHLQYKGGLESNFPRFISLRSYINPVYCTLRAVTYTQVTLTYNHPEYRDIYHASTPVYDTILEELCILGWSYVIVISSASKSDIFSVAQAGGGHLGPDLNCTVYDGGPPKKLMQAV